MIISHTHRYVYIGIPRTGSKSMNRWLMDHFDGTWVDFHHSWRVPTEAQDYLIFTIVRNPYQKAKSGWFHIPWSAENPDPIQPTEQFAAEMAQTIPLKDGGVTIPSHNVPEVGMNQAHYVKKAGVKLVLYFERLPACLRVLSFVDPDNLPSFPHKEERGPRIAGTFFDHFHSPEDEATVWAYADDDFAKFGYERYSPQLPDSAEDFRWIS